MFIYKGFTIVEELRLGTRYYNIVTTSEIFTVESRSFIAIIEVIHKLTGKEPKTYGWN